MRLDGWIYILSNEAFADGRIKIGCSSKDPNARKEELESSGVPEKFHLEYRALVPKFSQVETEVHKALAAHRPNKNREFFTCSIPTAINTIRDIVGKPKIKYEEVLYIAKEEIEEERQHKERLETKRKIYEENRKGRSQTSRQLNRTRQAQDRRRREKASADVSKFIHSNKKPLKENLKAEQAIAKRAIAKREDQKHRNKVAIWILILGVIWFVYVFLNTPGL